MAATALRAEALPGLRAGHGVSGSALLARPATWSAAVASVLALPLALVTQLTILLRAPFARVERLGLATSAFVLFEYDALSRSLTLGVALLVLAFAFRARRCGWVPLALLPMADLLFGTLSVVLVVLSRRERRLWAPGLVAWGAVAAVAAWSVRPAPDVVPAFAPAGLAVEAGAWLNRLSVLLLPVQVGTDGLTWSPRCREVFPASPGCYSFCSCCAGCGRTGCTWRCGPGSRRSRSASRCAAIRWRVRPLERPRSDPYAARARARCTGSPRATAACSC